MANFMSTTMLLALSDGAVIGITATVAGLLGMGLIKALDYLRKRDADKEAAQIIERAEIEAAGRRKEAAVEAREMALQEKARLEAENEEVRRGLHERERKLDKAEDELSRTIKEHKADIAVVSGQLDRVESARSQYNKTRVLMLYRMHLLLSPDQRAKLEAIRARNDQGRRDRTPAPGYRRYP